MWGIVEKVIDDKIYVVFSDLTYKVFVNDTGLKIVENNEVEIKDEKIINVRDYNEDVYHKIKQLEKTIIKN